MDAKPQRPTRNLKIYDENALPAVGTQKTIHQRNKSSPALSSLSQIGAIKPAVKRTAFGDLSNISNLPRPSKDDSAIGAKGEFRLKENLPPIQGKKAATFQKPAQRPVSVNGLKSLVNHIANTAAHPIVKRPLTEIEQSISQPKAIQSSTTQEVATEKNTIVYNNRETLDRPLPESVNDGLQVSLESAAPPAPVHRELSQRPPKQPSHDAIGSEPKLCQAPSKYVDGNEAYEDGPITFSQQPLKAERVSDSDGIYIDDRGDVQIYSYPELVDHHEKPSETIEDARLIMLGNQYSTKIPLSDEIPTGKINNIQIDPPRRQKLAPVSEPEEYWEEEDPGQIYDEEGFVTARSFKSRGDNTTGGATTVVFPKQTQKAKKEIALAKELIEGSKTVEELEDEAWDTTMVAEYGDEIFQYMRDLEIRMLPNTHYMDNQAEIQWSMRAVLMDWIVQVHHRFNLLPETLFLCVNYIDRFLSCKVVSLGKLQLVGATAIFIAAKYEEIDCPSVQEIVYMVDGGYTVDEILKAERFMLTMLQFELGWPGPMSFLRRISKADDYDLETRTLAKYFLEITIMDERFVGSPPSFVAAGAHCLARMMLRKGPWSPAHVYYSNYTYSQLYSLVLLMVECCEDARKHHCAVYDKYMDKRFKRASLFVENEMRKGFQLLPITTSLPSVNQTSYASPYDIHPPEIWCKA